MESANASSKSGGFFWVDYSYQTHTATVGYVSRGSSSSSNSDEQNRPVLARVMPGANLRGMDLMVLSSYKGNWSTCQALCDATAACNAWTWCTRCPDTSKCCLKSGIPTPSRSTNASMHIVSGVKSPLLVDQCPMGANHSACTPTDTLRLAANETTVSLRVFTDGFAEAYFQAGRVVITASTPSSSDACVSLVAMTPVVARNATVWAVKPIWTTPDAVLATPKLRMI